MKYKKGQWYRYENHFWQYDGRCFRHAGDEIPVKNLSYANKLTPASLTPDFSNANVGDKCWGYDFENATISFIYDSCVQVKYESKSGFDQTAICWDDGKIYGYRTHDANGLHYLDWESKHPTLFNSFAQFQAYWDEEALKMKGCKDADIIKINSAKQIRETELRNKPLYQIGDAIRLHITGNLSNLLGDIDVYRVYFIKSIKLNSSTDGNHGYVYEVVNDLIYTQNTVSLKEIEISPLDTGGSDV